MKPLRAFALLLLALLVLSGCEKAAPEQGATETPENPQAEQPQFNYPDDTFASVDTIDFQDLKAGELVCYLKSHDVYSVPLKDLTAYSYSLFSISAPSRSYDKIASTASSRLFTLASYHQQFPIQSLKVLDADHVLLTYKLEKDGALTYVYTVFDRKVTYHETGKRGAGYYETWGCYGEYYFATATNTREDFSELKPGHVMTEAELDRLAIDFGRSTAAEISESGDKWGDYCLLKEGILKIQLLPTDSGEPEVRSVAFYPYGQKNEQIDAITIILFGDRIELP